MNIEKLARQYLEDVNTVLHLFKSKVGEAKNGMAWQANIPRKGSFTDLGITYFKRHGAGVFVELHGKVIDFDFVDLNVYEIVKSEKFISIDVGFLSTYIRSLVDEKFQYDDIEDELIQLIEKGILEKKTSSIISIQIFLSKNQFSQNLNLG